MSGMAEPEGRIPRPRLELSLPEARTRFVQLARLAELTRQRTVVTDGGRPLAAIVPVDDVRGGASAVAAGSVRRIEILRAEFQRRHGVLEEALEQVWRELDKVRPPGSDAAVDALRLAHADLRRPR
jgi:antitoxin (DNA-binding transcriptional repressor) of toxin-antitoxin stability system